MRTTFAPRVLHRAPACLPDGFLRPRTPHQVGLLHTQSVSCTPSSRLSPQPGTLLPGHHSIHPLRLWSPGSSLTSRSKNLYLRAKSWTQCQTQSLLHRLSRAPSTDWRQLPAGRTEPRVPTHPANPSDNQGILGLQAIHSVDPQCYALIITHQSGLGTLGDKRKRWMEDR